MGKLKCTRILEPLLGGNYIQMTVQWNFSKSVYQEHAIIGIRDSIISFWSFTSDGKNSQGSIADGTDIHPEAICFEAQMPAELAGLTKRTFAELLAKYEVSIFNSPASDLAKDIANA